MARIFQKYVTSEGRSETPPEVVKQALRQVTSGPTTNAGPELGGSSVKFSDMKDSGKRDEEEDDAPDMTTMVKGMRSMMQFFTQLTKVMKAFG